MECQQAYPSKVIMLVVPPVLKEEIASILGNLTHRVKRAAIALQLVTLSMATVRVMHLVAILAPIVEPMFTLTLALMAHSLKVIIGANNNFVSEIVEGDRPQETQQRLSRQQRSCQSHQNIALCPHYPFPLLKK